MEEKFDVVIAGAGVAGCLMARNLARQGHSVALMDKQAGPKLGHDWWDSVHTDVFDEVGLPAPEPPEAMNTTGDEIVFPPLETMAFHIPMRNEKRNIDRKLFAARMLKYAIEAGARFFEKTEAADAIYDGETVVGMVAKDGDGRKKGFRAQLVVDATGFAAALRNHAKGDFGFDQQIDRTERLVTYREIRNKVGESQENILVFGKANGVTWIRRSQVGLIDFFAGVIDIPGRPDPFALVDELKRRVSDYGPEMVRAGSGALIPVRRGFDSFVAPGFLLCGDSACQCNPIDGSGVASSLRGANFAADTIHQCIENGRFDVDAMWPYNVAYKRTQGVKFATLNALQRFMISEPKIHLEILFRRGVLNPAAFWGSGSAGGGAESKLSQIFKLMKLLDRPRFIGRLLKTKSISKKVEAHYMDFPESFDPYTFKLWREETARLFAGFPPPWDVK